MADAGADPAVEALEFADVAEWEAWLAAHHDEQPSAWLRIARKHSHLDLIAITDALDGALCFGWIDGQRKGLDDDSFLQRYSRRRPRSSWSRVNVGKVEALLAADRMQPPGLAEVNAAKADGRWDAAYESQRTADVPPELAAALAADPRAQAAFDQLGRSERYAVILPVLKARTDQARATVVAREVARLIPRAWPGTS